MMMIVLIRCPHTVINWCFNHLHISRMWYGLHHVLVVQHSNQLHSLRVQTGVQGRTDQVPWAVAGACAWIGVEDPDTMQGGTLLTELEPGDRAPDISERLPDLQ